MKDYSIFIEEGLDSLMPWTALDEAKSIEYPVKDAPSIKGYFGFIGLKYMKRVRNIKKACVEYINTYVEGAMNVANNIDKVKLTDELENNLASDIGYKGDGISTQNKEITANTLTGVSFIAGDKALKDKLASIVKSIATYASKSESLKEWANLMVEKSKQIACQIVFDKAKEKIDGKDAERLQQKIDAAVAEKDKEIEELKKATEELSKQMEKVGDFSGVNNGFYNADKIKEIASTKYEDSMKLDITDENNLLAKERAAFYGDSANKWNLKNFDDYTERINKVLEDDKVKTALEKLDGEDKTNATNAIKNYALSALLAIDADLLKKGQYLCPVDLQVLRVNLSPILKGKIAGSNSSNIDGYAASPDMSKVVNGLSGDALNAIKDIQLDNNRMFMVAQEWAYTFNKEKSKYADPNADQSNARNEHRYVLSFSDFITEMYGNN